MDASAAAGWLGRPVTRPKQELQQQSGDPFSYDNLMRQASRSPVDALTGKVRCLECGRLFNECLSLAKHLRDRHDGRNGATSPPALLTYADRLLVGKTAHVVPAATSGSALAPQSQQQPQPRRGVHDLRGGFTLADVLSFKAQASQPPAPARRTLPLDGQAALYELRQLVRQQQAAQASQHPGQANPSFGKQREGPPKRKLSRLKRTLLREKADKAAALAVSACEAANAALKAASELLSSTTAQLKEAEAKLRAEQAQGSAATKMCTEVQVLRLAKDQAEQQLQLSIRRALEADAEKQTCLSEQAALWNGATTGASIGNAPAPSAPDTVVDSDSNLAQLVRQLQLQQPLTGKQVAAGAPVVHGVPGHLPQTRSTQQQQAALVEQLLQRQQQKHRQQLEEAPEWVSAELTAQVAAIAPELFTDSAGAQQSGGAAGWIAQQQKQQSAGAEGWGLLMAVQQQQAGGWQAPAAGATGRTAEVGCGGTSSSTAAAEQLLATCKEVLHQQRQQQEQQRHTDALRAAVVAAQQPLVPAAPQQQAGSVHFPPHTEATPLDAQAALQAGGASSQVPMSTHAATQATPSWLLGSDSEGEENDDCDASGAALAKAMDDAESDDDDDVGEDGFLSGQVDVLSGWMAAANIGHYAALARSNRRPQAQQAPSEEGAGAGTQASQAGVEGFLPHATLPPASAAPAMGVNGWQEPVASMAYGEGSSGPTAGLYRHPSTSLPPRPPPASNLLASGSLPAMGALPCGVTAGPNTDWATISAAAVANEASPVGDSLLLGNVQQPTTQTGRGDETLSQGHMPSLPSGSFPQTASALAAAAAASAMGGLRSNSLPSMQVTALGTGSQIGAAAESNPAAVAAAAAAGNWIGRQLAMPHGRSFTHISAARSGSSSSSGSAAPAAAALQPFMDMTPVHHHHHVAVGNSKGHDESIGLPATVKPGHAFCDTSDSYHCDICGVTCSTLQHFEQHAQSRKHLRRVESVAASRIALQPDCQLGVVEDSRRPHQHTTYIGPQGQCREYCTQVISADLNMVVSKLLYQLCFWQERAKQLDPTKAAMRKRLVCGLREVAKAVKLKKAHAVVVAPNIEACDTQGGPDDLLQVILEASQVNNTPVVFALTRKKMGQVFGSRKKMSTVAIINADGANELFGRMLALAAQGRQQWNQIQSLQHQQQGVAQSTPTPATTLDAPAGSPA